MSTIRWCSWSFLHEVDVILDCFSRTRIQQFVRLRLLIVWANAHKPRSGLGL